ncbi:hypothetical protein ACJ3XI_05995 [Litorimonas sp. RW-G-Af-16]|uniref:hypothetical protein n=1 Tax=Litorimonas sp. RW-G-Af-16 TaxID=3241168 RepID=UPI00390CB971
MFSGLSLTFGAMMCYVALHYVPAFTSTHKVLSFSNGDTSAARLQNRNPVQKLLGPYADAFSLKRTYLRAGQSIQVQYAIPAGAKMDLNIVQCRRLWVIEVFTCQTVSRKHVEVTKKVGTETFRFQDTGFYFFDETVTLGEKGKDYRVVWTRK